MASCWRIWCSRTFSRDASSGLIRHAELVSRRCARHGSAYRSVPSGALLLAETRLCPKLGQAQRCSRLYLCPLSLTSLYAHSTPQITLAMPQDAPKATAAMSMGARARATSAPDARAEAVKAPNAGAQPKPDDAEVLRLRGGDGHRACYRYALSLTRQTRLSRASAVRLCVSVLRRATPIGGLRDASDLTATDIAQAFASAAALRASSAPTPWTTACVPILLRS